MSAVWRLPGSRALTSTPRGSSSSTTSRLPARAAAISTVSPLGFTAWGSAPASSSVAARVVLPFLAASDRRRLAVLVGRVGVGARAEQHAGRFGVVVVDGPQQCGGAVRMACVDVEALVQQGADGGRLVASGGIDQPRVVGRGVRAGGQSRQRQQQQYSGHMATALQEYPVMLSATGIQVLRRNPRFGSRWRLRNPVGGW